jgi:phage-related protein (TIGR01555 family)
MSAARQVVHRIDSWVNALTGLGGLRDKLSYTQILPGMRLTDGALEALYDTDDIAAKIIDKLPRDATRRGFTLEFEGDGDDESAAAMRALDAQLMDMAVLPTLRESWIWARLYGAGAVYLGADDGLPPEEALAEDRIAEVRFLNVLTRPQLQVRKRYDDVHGAKFGEPELYAVRRADGRGVDGRGAGEVLIHESRLVVFPGALTSRSGTQSTDDWDNSVLQRVHDRLKQSASSWQSAAHLMTDASQAVLKIDHLVDIIATGGESQLRTRMEMMDMARSVCRAILVDAEHEEFTRVATSFTGLPEMLDRFMMRDAAAAEMPVALLYGRSAAGMNATGESDTRGWYDVVEDAQNDVLRPRLERVVRVFMLAKNGPTHGQEPENWRLVFNPLWQPTAKEQAETRKLNGETIAVLVNSQVIFPEEGALALAQSGDFSTLDVEARRQALEIDRERAADPEGTDPEGTRLDPAAPAGASPTDPSVQDTALNGAQVTSMLEIVTAVASGQIPRATGVQMLTLAFQMSAAEAEKLMGETGAGFTPAAKPTPPQLPPPPASGAPATDPVPATDPQPPQDK